MVAGFMDMHGWYPLGSTTELLHEGLLDEVINLDSGLCCNEEELFVGMEGDRLFDIQEEMEVLVGML